MTGIKFRIARDDFADAVNWVARSLPARPPVPVLAGVLIVADDNGLTVSGFDYEVSTQMRVAAEIDTVGRILVSGRLLAGIAKALPNKPVDVSVDSERMQIACGTAKFALPTLPVEDYPELPDMPDQTGTVDAHTFAQAVMQVATASGHDDTLPMLTGIRMEIDGNGITLAATDRFRLAVRHIEWQPVDADMKAAMLVPAKTLMEAVKVLEDSAPVGLSIGDKGLLGIVNAGRRTTTRLLDAEFPKFRQLFPKDHTAVATVVVADLVGAIKRVALVSERGAQVRLAFADGTVLLAAGGEDNGRAEEAVDADFQGAPLTIAFNPGFLADALGALHADRVAFAFTTPSRPGVLTAAIDDVGVTESGAFTPLDSAYRHLLMPVRLPS